ncbi:hypothetical protein RhiirA4_441022 [Rhizophagus irregularis]|uniref:Uncharacterized protein n=1 Tax=Rhizophagus irregularis TaxID=588596 RepID=A0A2I1G2Y5_9GLOM|nr:hypothetical protein RhiirA4_441022 [Rhizophagus irregularis]
MSDPEYVVERKMRREYSRSVILCDAEYWFRNKGLILNRNIYKTKSKENESNKSEEQVERSSSKSVTVNDVDSKLKKDIKKENFNQLFFREKNEEQNEKFINGEIRKFKKCDAEIMRRLKEDNVTPDQIIHDKISEVIYLYTRK